MQAPRMSPAFYSLGMLLTGRVSPEKEAMPLRPLDLLAAAIADEEQPPHPLVTYIYDGKK